MSKVNNFDNSVYCVSTSIARTNDYGPAVDAVFLWQYATWVYRDLKGSWWVGDGSGPLLEAGTLGEAAIIASQLWEGYNA